MRESEQGTLALTNKSAQLGNVYNLEDTIQADVPVEMITGTSSLSGAAPGSGAASHEDAPEKLNWFEENTL